MFVLISVIEQRPVCQDFNHSLFKEIILDPSNDSDISIRASRKAGIVVRDTADREILWEKLENQALEAWIIQGELPPSLHKPFENALDELSESSVVLKLPELGQTSTTTCSI